MLTAAYLAAALAFAPPACTVARAEPTTVREMAANPSAWLGRCVRLRGHTIGYTFYQDLAGAYRYDASDKEDRPNDGWLGLYFIARDAYRRRPLRASVVGIVHDCDRDYAASEASLGPNEIVFMTGYCHYRGGLILRDVTIRHGGPMARVRQVGEAARLRFGDLQTVAEAGPPPAEAAALVDRFLAAFEAGNAGALAEVADGYDSNIGRDARGIARWQSFLAGMDGPFARLRISAKPRPVYFQARISRHDRKYEPDGDWFACFCTAKDCEGKWPISARDARVEEGRPYLCLRAYREPTVARTWKLGVETRQTRWTEPRSAGASRHSTR